MWMVKQFAQTVKMDSNLMILNAKVSFLKTLKITTIIMYNVFVHSTASTTDSKASSSCDVACIIGIVLAILAVIIITTVVIVVAFVLYKYLNDPATKLAKTDAEGLNG